MSIQSFPQWQRLAAALGTLAAECGAANVYLLDAWANLWCAGQDPYDGSDNTRIMEFTHRQLAALRVPLNRGGRIDRAYPNAYLRSFAGVYVIVVDLSGRFDVSLVRAAVGKALPNIEALTLALPPPDGPESGGAAGFGSA